MKKFFKRVVTAALSVVLCGYTAISASAKEPYDVYNYDRWGEPIPSQAGYTAERVVSGYDLEVGAFDMPSDIFCAFDGNFYITDTGNNRIVAVDGEFSKAVEVYDKFTFSDGRETTLKKPSGVFVSAENQLMYIADTENSRVLITNLTGNAVGEITKPDTEIYGSQRTFNPQRVIADKAGNVYVVLNNITTGAAMFSPNGEFMGFYGANRVQPTAEIIGDYVSGIFMSEEKRARRTRNVPTGITSFDIEGDFIYTCTSSSTQTTDTVKKLNAAGKNIFAGNENIFGDYSPMYDTSQNRVLASAIVDIDIAEDGNINCLDLTMGRIFQYDEDCNLLFIVGTNASQVGGFRQAAALESCGDRLYVTDTMKNTVTIFKETDFGEVVHKASTLHNGGYYEEALNPWLEVLKYDGTYRRAYLGIAAAKLRSGEYEEAMKYAKLADAGKIYDKAFEGYRLEFIRNNFEPILLALIFAAIAVAGTLKIRKDKKAALAAEKNMEKSEEKEER